MDRAKGGAEEARAKASLAIRLDAMGRRVEQKDGNKGNVGLQADDSTPAAPSPFDPTPPCHADGNPQPCAGVGQATQLRTIRGTYKKNGR